MHKILDDVKVMELLNLLERKKNLTIKLLNTKKYCKYHKNYSHKTNECVALKNDIKDLIWKGYLQQYKKYYQNQPQQPYWWRNKHPYINEYFDSPSYSLKKKNLNKGKEITLEFETSVVVVIARSFIRGGLSNNDRKRHLQAVMTVKK